VFIRLEIGNKPALSNFNDYTDGQKVSSMTEIIFSANKQHTEPYPAFRTESIAGYGSDILLYFDGNWRHYRIM